MKVKALKIALDRLMKNPDVKDNHIKICIEVEGAGKDVWVKLRGVSYCGPDYTPVLLGKANIEDLLT